MQLFESFSYHLEKISIPIYPDLNLALVLLIFITFLLSVSFLPSQSLGNLSIIHFYFPDSYLLSKQCSLCFLFPGKGHSTHIHCPMLS